MGFDANKHRDVHKLKGTRVLDDKRAEAVAYLLADGHPEADVCRLQGITSEEIDGYRQDLVWQRRFAHLSNTKSRKRPMPRTHDQYMQAALKTLYGLSRKSQDDKARISAAEAMGLLAHKFSKDAQAAEPQAPAGDTQLLKAFNEGK